MLLPMLLTQAEIAIINQSRATHGGIIVHPGYELSMLVAAATAEKLRPALTKIRADRSKRGQVRWRISVETNAKLLALGAELDANRIEVVRAVILLRGEEMEASSESETGCKACEACASWTVPRTDPDRFIIAALSANNREGNLLPVQQLANAILSVKPELVVISRWNPAAIGSSELRDILRSYGFEIFESRFRPEPSENGFMLLYKSRFRNVINTTGVVPGVFFPLSLKDIMSGKDVIIIAIDSDETQEERIEDIKRRFSRAEKITVWNDGDINIAAVSNGVRSVEALESDGVLTAVIKYQSLPNTQ